jgi:hypothetical protein
MLQSTLAASIPNQLPEPDIAQVIRWRDSSYSADLYIAAVSWLDLFTYLDQTPATEAELRSHFQIKERPARTMIGLFESWGLLDNIDGKLLASHRRCKLNGLRSFGGAVHKQQTGSTPSPALSMPWTSAASTCGKFRDTGRS